MHKLWPKLQGILVAYHRAMRSECDKYWEQSVSNRTCEENIFCELFRTPRDSFIKFCKDNSLNYSSIAGIIIEWSLYHFLNAGLSAHSKTGVACVINRHPINFKWKKKGNKRVNLDVVIKSKKTSKLYYAFEMKTEFEDNFKKYRQEEENIYHHRRKNFSNFKYYYLSLSSAPQSIKNKYRRDLKTLQGRKELYIINTVRNGYPGPKEFLESISEGIQKIE